MKFITFGNYPTGQGGEIAPIVWQVLFQREDRMLVISRDCLDFQPFHSPGAVTWESSEIRTLLNEVFFYEAFSERERGRVAKVPVTTGRQLTFDYLFLPSVLELKRYFRTAVERRTVPTEYARQRGRWNLPYACYWLRDTGYAESYAADVLPGGKIDPDGDEVYELAGVRPCMWVRC